MAGPSRRAIVHNGGPQPVHAHAGSLARQWLIRATRPRPPAGAAAGGAPGAGSGGGGGGSGRNRSRNRNRNRNRNRTGGGSTGGGGSGASGGRSAAGGGGGGGGKANARANARKKGQGAGGQRSSAQGGNRSGSRPRNGQGEPRTAVALEPPPPLEPLHVEPSLGAPEILPGEVAANRRRAIVLCAWTAVVPALLFGALFWAAVSPIFGIVAFVVAGAAVMYGVWRLAPSFALRRIGAAPIDEHGDPRLYNVTEGLCATFGLTMPSLHVVDDDVPNACALGRDARRSDLVVTTGLLRRTDPIELEGVIAHELAHVKRGDNGVSCIGITLGSLFGGETMLRRCVGGGSRVSSRRRRRVGRALPTRPSRRAADDGRGHRSGRRLLLRIAVPFRADSVGLDRSVGGAPRRPPRARRFGRHVGAGRRTERVVSRGGPPS